MTSATNSSIVLTPEGIFIGIILGIIICCLFVVAVLLALRVEDHLNSIKDMKKRIKKLEDDRSVK